MAFVNSCSYRVEIVPECRLGARGSAVWLVGVRRERCSLCERPHPPACQGARLLLEDIASDSVHLPLPESGSWPLEGFGQVYPHDFRTNLVLSVFWAASVQTPGGSHGSGSLASVSGMFPSDSEGQYPEIRTLGKELKEANGLGIQLQRLCVPLQG